MTSRIRVALVEDNQVFREALELLLELRGDFDIVASVGDGNSITAVCREQEPDVVVMDYRLPGLDGVQATAELKRTCPTVSVICLTGAADEREMQALLEAGALDCLTKDEPLDEIAASIHRAAGRLAPAD